MVDDLELLHVLHGLDMKQLGFMLWSETEHLVSEKNKNT